MMDREDPAILVLIVVPGSKIRFLLMSTIANLPTDPGFSSQETLAWSGEGVTPRFTVDLLSLDRCGGGRTAGRGGWGAARSMWTAWRIS